MAEMISYIDDIRNVWKNTLPWEKLSGKNILVTGATGLIGGCLVETLMANPSVDYVVYASGRNEERAKKCFSQYRNDCHFNFIKYDTTQVLEIDVPFDFIIHAASGAAPAEFVKHPVEVMKANLSGVINLIEYGINHQLTRFLYVSSGEVYGEGDGRVFTEEYSGYVDSTSSRSCYPSSKRASETLCASYAAEYGVDVVIARPCHTYGPHYTETDNRVYAQFIRNVLRNEDIVMKSSGEQFRSWCYVVDCVSALLHILLKGEKGQAYNIADANSNVTIKQLAEMIADIGKQRVVMDISADVEKSGFNPVSKSVFDTHKLENLGWHLEGNMTTKMKRVIDECRKRSI